MNRQPLIAAALLALTAAFGATGAHAQSAQPAPAYDYASKFYPHPAGLYLLAEQPRERHEHPAVVIWRQAHAQQPQETMAQAATKFYMHPAGLALATVAPVDATAPVLLAKR